MSYCLRFPASLKNADPSHWAWPFIQCIVHSDPVLAGSLANEPGFDWRVLMAPLDDTGITLFMLCALSSNVPVLKALLAAADAAAETQMKDQQLALRRELLGQAELPTYLDNAARLGLMLAEKQFLEVLSHRDANDRTILFYAASARGAIVGELLRHKLDRFKDAKSVSSGPLFPEGCYVSPSSGELWLPPSGEDDGAGDLSATGLGASDEPPSHYIAVHELLGARYDPCAIDARDNAGATPLVYATTLSDINAIRALIAMGADVYARTHAGDSPATLAATHAVRALLIPMGATVRSACGIDAPRAGIKGPSRGAAAALAMLSSASVSPRASVGGPLATSGGGGGGAGATSPAKGATTGSGFAPDVTGLSGGTRTLRGTALPSLGSGTIIGAGVPTPGPIPLTRGAAPQPPDEITRKLNAEEALLLLVNSGTDINERSGTQMQAPLHVAAREGAADVVTLLLQNGADVGVMDTNGCTPLHLAAELGTPLHQEVVKLLAEAGADVNATSSTRKTPLFLAATGGPNYSGRSDDPKASSKGESSRNLHADAADAAAATAAPAPGPAATTPKKATIAPGTPGGGGSNALASPPRATPASADRRASVASSHRTGTHTGTHASAATLPNSDGGSAMVSLLVTLGAKLEVQDEEGLTPLLAASKRGNFRAAETLLSLGANIYHQNIRGHTALHLAAFNHHVPVVHLLTRWDAEVGKLKHMLDASGRNSFDMGADPETRDSLHTLFEAAASGKLDLCQHVARLAALAAGVRSGRPSAHPWLPAQPLDVTRMLRRTALHAAITGCARAMAIDRARAIPAGPGTPRTPPPSPGSRPAIKSRGPRAPPEPRLCASSVHTAAGIGLRYVPGPSALNASSSASSSTLGSPKRGLAEAASARLGLAASVTSVSGGGSVPDLIAGLKKAPWGATKYDIALGFPEPDDPFETLAVDRYAYCAPVDTGSAGKPSTPLGNTLAAARAVPGSELTSSQTEKDFARIVDFLLRSGAAIDAQDVDGVTPLMLAAKHGLLYMVRRLLNKGADATLTDKAGNSALHYAFAFAQTTAAGIIEELVPVPLGDLHNAAGKTAAEVAAAGLAILKDGAERSILVAAPAPKAASLEVTRM